LSKFITKKEIKSAVKIAGVYTGLILGAGFASGRELTDFFARYGVISYAGIVLSGIIFALCGWAVTDICVVNKIDSYEDFSKLIFGKRLGVFIEYAVALFLIVLFATMLAASGAAFREAFKLPDMLGVMLCGVFCLVIFLFGAEAFVRINVVLAPVMVVGGVFIGLYSFFTETVPVFKLSGGALVYNWVTQSLVYACYNIVTAVSVLSCMREFTVSRKAAKYGGIAGGAALSLLGAALLIPLIVNYNSVSAYEIPMMYLVNMYSRHVKAVYMTVLLSAIVTTAVGNGYAFVLWLGGKVNVKKIYIKIFVTVLAVGMSSFGFSSFVGRIYPLFGFIGVLQIVRIIWFFARASILKFFCNARKINV
jgi:uncharacterized membrane protein YkvI